MKLPVNIANNFFKTSWPAYDVVQGYAFGRPAEPVRVNDRVLTGTIQPAGDKLQSQLPVGAQTSGALLIHTESELHYYDSSQDSESFIQTFVEFEGETWKVHAIQNWAIHIQTGINRYLLTKYVNLNDNGLL